MSDKETPKNYDLEFAVVFFNLAYLAHGRDTVNFIFCAIVGTFFLVLVGLDWYRKRLQKQLGDQP